MRAYLKRRRLGEPARELWHRARERARRTGVEFNLEPESIAIPQRCPVLGIPFQVGVGRVAGSPSLDRIVPQLGYVADNVRVISDRANRLKGARNLDELRKLAEGGSEELRNEYRQVLVYLERELLLKRVREAVEEAGRQYDVWSGIMYDLKRMVEAGQ